MERGRSRSVKGRAIAYLRREGERSLRRVIRKTISQEEKGSVLESDERAIVVREGQARP